MSQVTPEGEFIPTNTAVFPASCSYKDLAPDSMQKFCCSNSITPAMKSSSKLTNLFPVLWAQRSSNTDPEKNFIYLTISVPDVPKENLKLDLQPTGLTFTGHSETLKRTYHLDLAFYAEIDTAESKVHHTARNVELKLRKKELNDEYWPRLLKESKKVQFLKTDFDKWVDEDEQNEAPEEDFSQFGGMGM